MKKILFVLPLLAFILFLGLGKIAKAETPPAYTPVIKVDVEDSSKSNIYLQNPNTIQQKYFMTLDNVYREHYHAAEYHNGNLYIILKGINNNFELWRYNSKKEGKLIYTSKTIDFRVASDERLVVVIDNGNTNNIILMNKNGDRIKDIGKSKSLFKTTEVLDKNSASGANLNLEFTTNSPRLDWDTRYVWFYNTFGASHLGLVKIDTKSNAIKKYNISKLTIGSELAFNIFTEKLAYSTYPAMFDVESQRAFDQVGTQVSLNVHDLNKKTNSTLDVSRAKKFNPKWIGKHTIEYNDPYGNGRKHVVVW